MSHRNDHQNVWMSHVRWDATHVLRALVAVYVADDDADDAEDGHQRKRRGKPSAGDFQDRGDGEQRVGEQTRR